MARNIYKCTKRKFGRLYCAFMRLKEDPETGALRELGCALKMKDEYNMFPEHNSDGEVIRNNMLTSDPFPPGVSVIWENDSPHDTGLTFSFRRLRVEEYNMHPLYSIQETNEPFVTGVMGDDHTGYAFGLEDVSISPVGWSTQKILGLQRVEDCNMGLYGPFNKIEKMVMPKCLRDYSGDIRGWVNYTAMPDNPNKKTFFACDSTDEQISEFCQKKFDNGDVAAAVFQILVAIKHGEYINLWEALINNGLSREKAAIFMKEVSTKSKKTLYTGMNLQKYYLYWKALDKMGLPDEKVYLYRCHLLNYVLNYPPLRRLDPERDIFAASNGKAIYPTNKRFWWIALMIKDAMTLADPKKTSSARPYLTNPKIVWFRKLLSELEKVDPHKFDNEDMNNPAVETLYSIIGERKDTPGWKRQVRVFARLLLAGKKWSPPEVKISWIFFQRAYSAKKPEKFWQYVESVKGATPTALMNIRHEAGIFDDDTEFSQQRAFSHHLLEARKSRTSFVVEKPKLAERWSTITPKHGANEIDDDKDHIDYYEIFWRELTRIKMKSGNKYNYIFQLISSYFSDLPEGQVKELTEMYQDEMEEDVLIGRSLSKDDLGRSGKIQIEDIDGNEEIGGNEWHDSESLN